MERTPNVKHQYFRDHACLEALTLSLKAGESQGAQADLSDTLCLSSGSITPSKASQPSSRESAPPQTSEQVKGIGGQGGVDQNRALGHIFLQKWDMRWRGKKQR